MIYRVALCEDEQLFFDAQEKACRTILDRLNIEYHISMFSNSTDFLHAFCQEKQRYNLILLDIIMDGCSGMELAQQVREADQEAAIIFITSSKDYALEGYDVKALHYLIKPIDSELLEKLILSDYQNRFANHFFLLDSDLGKIQIAVKEMICMETVGRKVEVTLSDEIVYYPGKLTELLNELQKESFVRCHRAFALNIKKIRELRKQEAIAANGKRIPVSRTFSKEVKKAFIRQLRNI